MAKREKGRVQWAIKYKNGAFFTGDGFDPAWVRRVSKWFGDATAVRVEVREINPKPKAKRRAKR